MYKDEIDERDIVAITYSSRKLFVITLDQD